MRTVVIVLFDGVQSLDVTGPLEVFAGANRRAPATRPPRPSSSASMRARSRFILTGRS